MTSVQLIDSRQVKTVATLEVPHGLPEVIRWNDRYWVQIDQCSATYRLAESVYVADEPAPDHKQLIEAAKAAIIDVAESPAGAHAAMEGLIELSRVLETWSDGLEKSLDAAAGGGE